MLPLSDAPNPPRLPIVTYALIAVNVLVFVMFTMPLSGQRPSPGDPRIDAYVHAMREAVPPGTSMQEALGGLSEYDLFVFDHGYKPGAAQATDLLAAMFLHGGFMHLFGNMLFLWIYGDNVEYRLGRWKYLLWYLLTGAAATLFFSLLSPGSLVQMVGASGAISGVLGFYFWWFPRNVVRVLLLFFPFLVRVVQIPARIVLGIYLVLDNLLPMLTSGGPSGGGVAHGAHIGGFIAGVAAAWFMGNREVTAAPAEYRKEPAATPAAAPSAAAVERAFTAGDLPAAASAYFALPPQEAREALDAGRSIVLGRWLEQNGHGQAALTIFQRHIRNFPRGPGLADAHLGAGLVQLQDLGQPTSAYQHFLEALQLDPSSEVEAQARAGLEAITRNQKLPARRWA
jgi:membrane associated rhomboid family serine protease